MVYLRKGFSYLVITIIYSCFMESAYAGYNYTARLIVKYKNTPSTASINALRRSSQRIKSIGKRSVLFSRMVTIDEAVKLAKELKSKDVNIEYVEPDIILRALKVPGDDGTLEDPLYIDQWHHFDELGGVGMPAAWEKSVGESDMVVAVIDTGIRPHVDLVGKILSGYDFISDLSQSNDGDGRDSDPRDPGDWISPSDFCSDGTFMASSWHGTHVAGIIGAYGGNGVGGSGVNWQAQILPVRVLGKCGGYTSDIIDGIRWAVGLEVSGVPINPHPAQVINLSLGGQGFCGFAFQEAINEVIGLGVSIVVAAGNEDKNIDYINYTPANCDGVISVAATTKNLDRAFYSNYGGRIDISAPGGDDLDAILSTANSGSTVPADDNYITMFGTSMSAPIVTGVVSIMRSLNLMLSPAQIRSIIKDSAKSFPLTSSCNNEICGSGLLDAASALDLALITVGEGPIAIPAPVSSTPPLQTPVVDNQRSEKRERSGGSCATIDDSDNGGAGGSLPGLVVGLLLSFVFFTRFADQKYV